MRLLCDERGANILVDDDGPGIAEARREEAFRPFHRLDEGRNLQMGGLGLGLAIARAILAAHGGGIVATSELGKGASFRFWVPLVEKVPETKLA